MQSRAFKKEQELNEKLDEAALHLEQVSLIIKKFEGGINDRILKEAEDNLKLWASEVDVSSNNMLFPVPSLSLSISEYSEYKSLTKFIQISSIISDCSPLHSQSNNKLKLYMPFGYPIYSYYYLINLSHHVTCSTLVSSLLSYLNLESADLSYKNPPVLISSSEKINQTTKELYLIINY